MDGRKKKTKTTIKVGVNLADDITNDTLSYHDNN